MKLPDLEILHMTTALRSQMLDLLTDDDLAFAFSNTPTLGQLCRGMGDVQRMYIESFISCTMNWQMPSTAAPGVETSVDGLKAWFAALDAELDAALLAIPDADLHTKTIDRGGFTPTLFMQMHVYREALLIFCAKCDIYLRSLEKTRPQQWRAWIG